MLHLKLFFLLFLCPQFFMLLPLMICQSLASFLSLVTCLARVWASSGCLLLFIVALVPEYLTGLAPFAPAELLHFAAINTFGTHFLLKIAAIHTFGTTILFGLITNPRSYLSKKFFLLVLLIDNGKGGSRYHRRWSSSVRWWSVSAYSGIIFRSGPDHLSGILLTF